MRRNAWARIAVLLGAVAIMALLVGPTIAEEFTGEVEPDPSPPEVVSTYPAPDIPELTREEKEKVVSIAEQDSYVQQAFADRDYHVQVVGVWHVENSMEKIGGVVTFAFSEPATIEMDWPGLEFDDPETGAYTTYTQHFRATNVTELLVAVDLNRGEVVAVGPGLDSEVSGLPSKDGGGS